MASEMLIREDDRTMAVLRRRSYEDRKRKARRQAPVVFNDDDGSESGSENESSTRLRTQTQIPILTTRSRLSNTSQISFTTPAIISTSDRPLPPQTTSTIASPTTITQQQSTLLPSTTSPPRRPVSSIITEIKSSASPSPTASVLIPVVNPVNQVAPVQQTRTHKTLSHGATVALEVLGILLAISVFCLLGFFIRRRMQKRSKTSPPPPSSDDEYPNEKPSQATTTDTTQPTTFLKSIFTRPISTTPSEKGAPTRSEYNRNTRLSRVRPELLAPRNLNGDFMRSHTRDISNKVSLDTIPSSPTTAPSEETTRKAFLKRNTTGKMVMKPADQQKKFSFGYDPREEEEGRVVIEASGQWDDAKTVARGSVQTPRDTGDKNAALLKPLQGLMAAKAKGSSLYPPQVGKMNDPMLMSGGLRNSTNTLPALKGLDNKQDGVPYQAQTASEAESGALGLGGLEGLRRGEERDEFGRLARERQSVGSGTVRSTTSWNTSVWERLEKERVGRNGREGFEGGMGGSNRVSTATSVAVFRSMGKWVEDQAERRGAGGGADREKKGMEKLDG